MMKILKISADGLPLFNGKCELDFLATNRVSENNAEKMNCLFSNASQDYFQNNVVSFVGINASGKTSILKLFIFICWLLNNEPLNNSQYRELFDGLVDNEEAVFDTWFYADNNTVNLLHTVITKKSDKLIIKDEYMKSKPISEIKSKTKFFDFEDCPVTVSRNNDEAFLLDDVSIIIAFNKRNKFQLSLFDMLHFTDENRLNISEDCPAELIALFDPSIEYLHFDRNGKDTNIRLCFKGKSELALNKVSDLNRYLSSGTIKGINIFVNAIKAFETGGYVVVDELENHFNYEIVAELIRFFMDKRINPNGATLVFSTHYSEILDEFERNDNIYIVRNNGGIGAEKLCNKLKRTDVKKSEAFQSDLLNGTAPSYDAYMALKKSLISARKEEA